MGEIADLRTGLLYAITMIADGRTYVGSTANPFWARKAQHKCLLRRGTHYAKYLQRCFTKYGEDAFSFTVIASGIPIDDLIQTETDALRRLRPVFNGDQPCASRLGSVQKASSIELTRAANLGRKHTTEQNARKSRGMIGNKRAIGNSNARKVTSVIKAKIHELVDSGLGSYRIGHIVGLSKKTIINVRKGVH